MSRRSGEAAEEDNHSDIRLAQVSTSVGQDDGPVGRGVLMSAADPPVRVFATIVEIALRHDAEGTNGGQHAAFGAVDLVNAIAFSNWPSLTLVWQVGIPREHVARVTIGCMMAFAAPTAAAAVSVAEVVAVTTVSGARIVSVPHDRRIVSCTTRLWRRQTSRLSMRTLEACRNLPSGRLRTTGVESVLVALRAIGVSRLRPSSALQQVRWNSSCGIDARRRHNGSTNCEELLRS